MESLIGSMGKCLQKGKVPTVSASRRLGHCLFPVRQHPRIAALEKQLMQGEWGTTYGSAWAEDLQQMATHDEAGLAAYFWPNSTDDKRIITLLKVMHWIFLVDDAIDGLSGVQADHFCNRLIQQTFSAPRRPRPAADTSLLSGHPREYLRGGASGQEEEPLPLREKEPLIVAVGLEWWNELQDGNSSPAQSARFAAYFTEHLLEQARFGHLREKLLKRMSQADTTSTDDVEGLLEEYVRIRPVSSGFDLCVKLVEYDVGLELDEGVLKNPLLHGLHKAVCDHGCWMNDIISFPREFVKGDVLLNLLPLLHMRNNVQLLSGSMQAAMVPFDTALSQAWQMTHTREKDCARLAHQLLLDHENYVSPAGNGTGRPELETYVETVCGITSGNWAWTVQSPRYELDVYQSTKSSPIYGCTATLHSIPTNSNYRWPHLKAHTASTAGRRVCGRLALPSFPNYSLASIPS